MITIKPDTEYGEIFCEVRQRVAAFKYWKEFWNQGAKLKKTCNVDDILDDAYRFLYSSVLSLDFLMFCWKKDMPNDTFEAYIHKALNCKLSKKPFEKHH